MITILNTSIITSHGSFTYKPCSLEQAKVLVQNGFQSAIGHDSTAQVISTLLGIDCKMNRIQYHQQAGDSALVFKLKTRAPEGKILTTEEIEEIGYEWGLLERTDNGQGEMTMKKFETNETNDHGYEIIFINPKNVETVEQVAQSNITRIRMTSGVHHIVRGTADQVAARLCPAIRG